MGNVSRRKWEDGVWADSRLRTPALAVALAFAKHAGKGTESVWVAWGELRRLTRLSNDGASRALRDLREAGWLELVTEARGPNAARYRLAIPSTPPAGGQSTPESGGQSTPESGGQSTPPAGGQSTPIENESTPNSDEKHSEIVPKALRPAESNHNGTTTMNHKETNSRALAPVRAHVPARPRVTDDFGAFWAAYPLRRNRRAAERAFAAMVKDGANPAAIIDGARRYAELVRADGRPDDKIKHPDGWLYDERWTDEIAPPQPRRSTADERVSAGAHLAAQLAERGASW